MNVIITGSLYLLLSSSSVPCWLAPAHFCAFLILDYVFGDLESVGLLDVELAGQLETNVLYFGVPYQGQIATKV